MTLIGTWILQSLTKLFRWAIIVTVLVSILRYVVMRQSESATGNPTFRYSTNRPTYIVKSFPSNRSGGDVELNSTEQIEMKEKECAGKRYLIYTCHGNCNGLGDRQIGMISSYLLAELTGRRFVVDITYPCDYRNAIQPNEYDWLACKTYALRKTNDSTVMLDYFEHRLTVFRNTYSRIDIRSDWKDDIYRIKMNFYAINFVRKYVKDHDISNLAWLVGLSNEEVVSRVMNILFRPNSRMELEITKFWTINSLVTLHDTGRTLVGVHIRVGQNPTLPKDRDFRKYRGRPNVTSISSYMERYSDARKYIILLATDSEQVRTELRKRFVNILTSDRSIVHVDHAANDTSGCDGFFNAALEQFLLSKCDTLLLTKSNFGELAALQSKTVKQLALYIVRNNSFVAAYQNQIFKHYKIQ